MNSYKATTTWINQSAVYDIILFRRFKGCTKLSLVMQAMKIGNGLLFNMLSEGNPPWLFCEVIILKLTSLERPLTVLHRDQLSRATVTSNGILPPAMLALSAVQSTPPLIAVWLPQFASSMLLLNLAPPCCRCWELSESCEAATGCSVGWSPPQRSLINWMLFERT